MWQSCKTPPTPFVRVEIKAEKGKRYLGYYTGFGVYLESYEHKVISKPKWWRYPPTESVLVKEFLAKLRETMLPGMAEEYDEKTD